MNMDLRFLKSNRFWGLVVIAIIGVLLKEGIIIDSIAAALITIVGGFIGIRTIDRASEFVGGARTDA
jgi:hypothetical protein